MALGKSVRLFLSEGTPGSLMTAEIMNWTGHVVAAPRSDLAKLLEREECRRTGLYLLVGDDPQGHSGGAAYIGEGDDISTRLRQHSRPEDNGGKDFWDRAIVFTSKDANLTKAHARYLESRFIQIATTAKRSRLVNGTAPPPIALPEADVSDMEYYIEQAKIILPVLGVNLLRTVRRVPQQPVEPGSVGPEHDAGPEVAAAAGQSPVFMLRVRKHDIEARAREIDGEFTVLAGSTAHAEWAQPGQGYENLHAQLVSRGAMSTVPDGKLLCFDQDVVFDSPSAAASVVAGRSTNGRAAWVTDDGMTYGQWQTANV